MPLEEYVRNLRAIVQHLRGVGGNNTVLITPPPVFEAARLIDRQRKYGAMADLEPERTNEMTGVYTPQQNINLYLQIMGDATPPISSPSGKGSWHLSWTKSSCPFMTKPS